MKPTTKPVVYLAAPFSAPTQEEMNQNIENAKAWLKWFVDHTDWAICAPWIPYVQTLPEAGYRERGVADNCAFIERCDLVVFVGDRMSAGMAEEYRHAIAFDVNTLDLIALGCVAPPATGHAELIIKTVNGLLASDAIPDEVFSDA